MGFDITPGEAVGAIPGFIALVGAIIGYGKMQQRLDELEEEQRKVAEVPAEMAGLKAEMKNVGRRLDAQDSTLVRMDHKLDRIVERVITNNHRV